MIRTIFVAGHIHTMNPRVRGGNALVVQDGRVSAVTTVAAARAALPQATIVDLGDATVTPGLIDAHIHLTEWALARTQVDLSTSRTVADAARAAAAASPTEGWVLGRGWNPHLWGGAYPDRHILDELIGHIPVALQSHDMHALWLNTRALQITGIGDSSSDPPGGRIVREHGSPTGVLLENAAQLVVPHLPRYGYERMAALLLAAQHELHRYGITGVHSLPGVYLRDPDPFPVLQFMQQNDQLRLRVLQHLPLERLDDALRVGLRSGFGNDWLRVGGVKMFLDGALGSRTAWMRAPYENSSDRGVQVLADADFRAAVSRAARGGIASVVHAIGDAAVALAFDVLASDELQPRTVPHRIEHVQCLPPECGTRLASPIVCSVQPAHLISDWRAVDRHWGDRAAHTYAFRFMLEKGAMLAFGSDAPVESVDPRHGLYAAVTRTDLAGEPSGGWHAEQRIDTRAALAAYTTGAAHAAGVAPAQAGLAPGALADFVAWKQDPLSIEPAGLLALEPLVTVIDGEIVFES